MASNFSSSSISSANMSSLIRTASGLVNTTHQAILKNLTITNNRNIQEESAMSSRRYLHMIGGWLLTAICLFGISFLFVTHFLGRREWRKYQQRLEEERKAVNHVIVDPKFMKYTKKGWRDIAFSL